MMLEDNRQRSSSELVFGVLRTLMIAYRMWGRASGLQFSALSAALGTSDGCLGSALAFLASEGLVRLDDLAGTVRLSDSGARKLLGEPYA